MCSAVLNPQHLNTKEEYDENADCSIRDNSQIQIKYAKMLEELDNESMSSSPSPQRDLNED